MAGGAADAALVVVHAVGLELEVGAAQGVGGVLDVAAPDHGFDVVLEEDGVRRGRGNSWWARGDRPRRNRSVPCG